MTSPVLAGPARPQPIEAKQPDGSQLTIRIAGDEFQNWTQTLDGYTVVRNRTSGYLEYALPSGQQISRQLDTAETVVQAQDLTPSGLIPGRDAPPAASKNLRPTPATALRQAFNKNLLQSENFQADAAQGAAPAWTPRFVGGPKKLLVILVSFADRALTTTTQTWRDKIFAAGSGAKTVANFYTDNSHAKLTISPVSHTQNGNATPGIISVTLTSNHPNSAGGSDYAQEISWLNEVLAAAAPLVDFAGLDSNGDGDITPAEAVIYFIPAGYEASGSSQEPSVWGHAWNGNGVVVSGKRLTNWAMNGELNNNDLQHPIGVLTHELGHQMCGIPDLYDTSYSNAGLGMFSLMSLGTWGADIGEERGTTPVSLDAWSRAYCQWDTEHTAGVNGRTHSFGPALSDTSLKLINNSLSATEYFLAENRHCQGWDKGLRAFQAAFQGGLLILHVDNAVGHPGVSGALDTSENDINTYVAGAHQGVVAEQAKSDYNLLSLTNYVQGHQTVLFYQGNNAAFTPSATPDSKLYAGAATGLGLSEISSPGSTMTAKVISETHPTLLPFTLLLGN